MGALSFGGVRAAAPDTHVAQGAIETPHDLMHSALGGAYQANIPADMGVTTAAARDPIFWCHHANIDRLWVKWSDPRRVQGVSEAGADWMDRRFTFINEMGAPVFLTAREILDTQFDLEYRYLDDPPRASRIEYATGPIVGGGGPIPASTPVLLAGTNFQKRLSEIEPICLQFANAPPTEDQIARDRFILVFRGIAFVNRTAPYDVYLVAPGVTQQKVGTLAFFGGGHAGVFSIDVTNAFRTFPRPLLSPPAVNIARWHIPVGPNQSVPMFDADAPHIAAIEFWKA